MQNPKSLPFWLHRALVLGTIAALLVLKLMLVSSYAASNHPVAYAAGQLAFDAATIKEYYAVIIEAGTLDEYWFTQTIDLYFGTALMMLSVLLGTYLVRLSGPDSYGARLGSGVLLLGLAASLMVTLTTVTTLIMLTDPQNIAQFMALMHSGFAVAKFAFMALAILALILLVLVGRFAGAYRPR